MKRFLGSILTAFLIFTAIAAFAAEEDGEIGIVIVNETAERIALATDSAPFMADDRVLVPVRAVCEALGAEVSWSGSGGRVFIIRGEDTIDLQLGSSAMYVGKIYMNSLGKEVMMDTVPVLADNRVFIPVRYLCEALGCTVEWDEAAQCVTIVTGGGVIAAPDSAQSAETNVRTCQTWMKMGQRPPRRQCLR